MKLLTFTGPNGYKCLEVRKHFSHLIRSGSTQVFSLGWSLDIDLRVMLRQ